MPIISRRRGATGPRNSARLEGRLAEADRLTAQAARSPRHLFLPDDFRRG